MSRDVKQCKASLVSLSKAHLGKKAPVLAETAKQLEALVPCMREEGVAAAFVKENGVAILHATLSEAKRHPYPGACAAQCIKAMSYVAPNAITKDFVAEMLPASKLGNETYAPSVEVLSAVLTKGDVEKVAGVPGLLDFLLVLNGHSTRFVTKCLLCFAAVARYVPTAAAVLRREGIAKDIIKDGNFQGKEQLTAASAFLCSVMDTDTAALLLSYKQIAPLLELIQHLPAVNLLASFLEHLDVRKEIDQNSLTSFVDYVATETRKQNVTTEAVSLMRALLSSEKRLLRVLHIHAVGSAGGVGVVELIQPFITHTDQKVLEFGCALMRIMAELRFHCEECGSLISDTRRYCSISRTSFCRDCSSAMSEGYVVENADFRWPMVPLLSPALDVLLCEVDRAGANLQKECGVGSKVENLMAMFDTMFDCVGDTMFTGISGDFLQVAANLTQNIKDKSLAVVTHSLSVLRRAASSDEYSAVVAVSVVHYFAKSIDEFDEFLVLQILRECITYASPAAIKAALASIIPKAYSHSARVKELVAHVVRAGLDSLQDDLVGDVVREGLTGALMEIARSVGGQAAKDDTIAAFAISLHHEHRSDFLSSPLLLDTTLRIFYSSENKEKIAPFMATVMRQVCGLGQRIRPEPSTPGRKLSSNPNTPLSTNSDPRGSFLSTCSPLITGRDTRSPSDAFMSTTTSPMFSSQTIRTAVPLIDGVLPQKGSAEKAAVVFGDEGFEVLFHFTQCSDSVKEDVLAAIAGLAPYIGSLRNDHVRTLLNIVVELSSGQRHEKQGALSSTIFLAVALDESLRTHFTEHALSVVIELAGSKVRETQEKAVSTLRYLNSGVISLKTETSMSLFMIYKDQKERFTLTGKATVEKVKQHFAEIFQNGNLGGSASLSMSASQKSGPSSPKTPKSPALKRLSTASLSAASIAVFIGEKEIVTDAELCVQLSRGAGVISINEKAPKLSVSPRRNSAQPKRKWKLGRELGSGAFGTVHHVVDEETTQQYAAKVFKLKRGDARQKMQESFMNEIDLLRTLDHENIVRYIDTQRKGEVGYIILEYVPGGSLLDFRRKFNTIPERVASQFIKHALSGLAYLHEHNVIHLDVKSANLLVNTNGVVKVADFGCGVRFEVDGGQTAADGRTTGTLPFMAPEVITERRFSTACDIWSMGCTVLEMVCGGLVWCPKCKDPIEFVHKVKQEWKQRMTPLDHLKGGQVSAMCRSFLERCLVIEPQKRASAVQLLDDPFVNRIVTNMAESDATLFCSNAILGDVHDVHDDPTVTTMFESVQTGTFCTSAPPTARTAVHMGSPNTAIHQTGGPTLVTQAPLTFATTMTQPPTIASTVSSTQRPKSPGGAKTPIKRVGSVKGIKASTKTPKTATKVPPKKAASGSSGGTPRTRSLRSARSQTGSSTDWKDGTDDTYVK